MEAARGTSRIGRAQSAVADDVEEGATYELRLVATDKGGTRISPIRRVTVPYDERNAIFGAAWTGTWPMGFSPGDYRDTLRTSSTATDTFTHAFDGTYVAWIAPASVGTATVTIDDGEAQAVDLSTFTGQRQVSSSRSSRTAATRS